VAELHALAAAEPVPTRLVVPETLSVLVASIERVPQLEAELVRLLLMLAVEQGDPVDVFVIVDDADTDPDTLPVFEGVEEEVPEMLEDPLIEYKPLAELLSLELPTDVWLADSEPDMLPLPLGEPVPLMVSVSV
jgi:hypothetical protein